MRVCFEAVVVEGDEACNYVVVEPGGYFGLYGTAHVHFQHLIKIEDDE